MVYYIIYIEFVGKLDLVVHAYNPDMWETEAGRSGFEDQPGLQSNK